VGQVIQQLQASRMSIILVEQNLRFALKFAEYIHILRSSIVPYKKEDILHHGHLCGILLEEVNKQVALNDLLSSFELNLQPWGLEFMETG